MSAILINFVDEGEARVVGDVIARHGYRSSLSGTVLVTNCPALLAIPVVGRAIGLHRVRSMTLGHAGPAFRTTQDSMGKALHPDANERLILPSHPE